MVRGLFCCPVFACRTIGQSLLNYARLEAADIDNLDDVFKNGNGEASSIPLSLHFKDVIWQILLR